MSGAFLQVSIFSYYVTLLHLMFLFSIACRH